MSALITSVRPGWVAPGGRIDIEGTALPLGLYGPPTVRVGAVPAQVSSASRHRIRLNVPPELSGGPTPIEIDGINDATAYVEVAKPVASGIHQVDSPAFDALGRLYVTDSGSRGTKNPVSVYSVSRDGIKQPVPVDIANPTSFALGPDGAMYVSSRFEGNVYRLRGIDDVEVYASELGVPTGIAFGPDGTLFVGDRTGSIFRVSASRQVEVYATLPSSVAAFHLAFGPDGCLYVTAPTLASHDPIYRITPDRMVDAICDEFGRPQGLAFDSEGHLYVADALAGASGLYRIDLAQDPLEPVLVLTAPMLIGVAFDPRGGIVLASNDTVWRLDVGLKPFWATTAGSHLAPQSW